MVAALAIMFCTLSNNSNSGMTMVLAESSVSGTAGLNPLEMIPFTNEGWGLIATQCDLTKLLELVLTVVSEIESLPSDSLEQLTGSDDAGSTIGLVKYLLNSIANPALEGICAKATCPAAIVQALDPTKLSAEIQAVLANSEIQSLVDETASAFCLKPNSDDGFCFVEAAGDLIDYFEHQTSSHGGAKPIPSTCGSGCFNALGEPYLTGLVSVINEAVPDTDITSLIDFSSFCGIGGGTPSHNISPAGDPNNDDATTTPTGSENASDPDNNNNDGDKGEATKKNSGGDDEPISSVVDQAWFVPVAIGVGCSIVGSVALAMVCANKRKRAGRQAAADGESMRTPLTPRSKEIRKALEGAENGAPMVAETVV